MPPSLYLINPSSDFATYFSGDILAASGFHPGAIIGDLGITTVAALAPDDFNITLCDENITPVDYNHPADWIGITGKVNQRQRMITIANEFRKRGKSVIIGGPYASLSPEFMRRHCDIVVRGEIEDIADDLFNDLRHRRSKSEYVGNRPNLLRSPVPHWHKYPNEHALMGAVQTSRGCPFECEFCDVIQYLGRKQRHKPIAIVLAELDTLYACGYRNVFLADDNFTVFRDRAKELLAAIAAWRRTRPMQFVTQVSIDAARDLELLSMCAKAGVTEVFIGIETPNEDSLRESKKRQNMHIDLTQETNKFVEHGIAVIAGMIVGFDADTPDVFSRQYAFAMSTAIPIFSLGALVAPDSTPLHSRIASQGRLLHDTTDAQAVPWNSNIRPLNMTSQELSLGLRRLCNALYSPEAFGERMIEFIKRFGRSGDSISNGNLTVAGMRRVDADAIQIALKVRHLGIQERQMWERIWSAVARQPVVAPLVTRMLFQYAQIRYMFKNGNYWEPRLASSITTTGT